MEIMALTTSEIEEEVIALAQILCECVAAGASVSFMSDLTQEHADVAKVLVRPQFQRRGIARALMLEVEKKALEIGRDLLVLDTLTGSGAEALYAGMGWNRVGEIPRYALTPNGEPKPTMVFYKELRSE